MTAISKISFRIIQGHGNYVGSVYTEIQEKKLLLKQMQPPSFKGEGAEVERDAEAWIEAMDHYFSEAGTTPANQAMLSTFRLTGDAKLWWKQHCKDCETLRAGHKSSK